MKMTKSIIISAILVLTSLLFSCSGGSDSAKEPITEEVNPPTKAVGTLPVNGEPCSDYEAVSGDDAVVSISFNWNAAQYAQNYELVVKEGGNEVFRDVFNALNAKVSLNRGRAFTWNVIAKNSDGQTNSDTMSFVTPGTPIGNYVPYAAEISLVFDALTNLNVSWVGKDEDGDVLTYDVEVREEGEIITEFNDLTVNTLDPIATSPDMLYNVQVISIDVSGNYSISEFSAVSP
tara:strand:+ start:12496 stop:13194 length:699 start_codon:yes stop_codon:yes gene_type:complete